MKRSTMNLVFATAAELVARVASPARHVRPAVLASLLVFGSLMHPLTAAEKIFYYNPQKLSGATGTIDKNGVPVTLQSYPGAFAKWSIVAGDAIDLFFYSTNGNAAVGRVDSSGAFYGTGSLGGFGAWTNILRHKGYLFFYNSGNGTAVAGSLGNSGFTQLGSWSGFASWTDIVSTTAGLLFYNQYTGAAVVCDLKEVYTYPPNGFAYVSSLSFVQRSPLQHLSTGWTKIVQTTNGVLFYNGNSGSVAMADFDSSGNVLTRSNSATTIKPGYSSIVAVNSDVAFYNGQTGDMAVGDILANSTWVSPSFWGTLEIRGLYPGAALPGCTLVKSVDPAVN